MNLPIEYQEYEKYQLENANKIITTNTFDPTGVRYVAGLDISFSKTSDQACAYLTVYDLTNNNIVYENYTLCKMTLPYVSGYLGLREVPEYLKLLDVIKGQQYYPQLLMVDGAGIFHPRLFGSACHIGYESNIPSIGVSKTLMCIDGLNEYDIKKEFAVQCKQKGNYIELKGLSKIVYGVGLKTSDSAKNPVYVSIGYGIDLQTAIHFVNIGSIYKIPECIRNSDIKSKLYFI